MVIGASQRGRWENHFSQLEAGELAEVRGNKSGKSDL
jgi:hypothetical protein